MIAQSGSYVDIDENGNVSVDGALPDDVVARAYPVQVEISGCTVLAAYDISLYRPSNHGDKASFSFTNRRHDNVYRR